MHLLQIITTFEKMTVKMRRILFFSLLLASCWQGPSLEELEKRTFFIQISSGKEIRTSLAVKNITRIRGLSGRPSSDFAQDQGMLFIFFKEDFRSFWMRDTYFNLDIIFLDKHFTVMAIERNVPHHPGSKISPPIYTTASYYCQYVLEIKADSSVGKDIKVGDKFIWNSVPSLEKIRQLMIL